MFRRIPPLTSDQRNVLVGSLLAAGLGLLPLGPDASAGSSVGGSEGGAVGMLAWLTLIAPACGALAGAAGLRPWPFGLAIPGAWSLALVWADLGASRPLPTPIWGACVIAGLHALGLGLGSLLPRRPWGLAGVLLFLFLLASALPVQAGFGRSSWAADSPRLARVLTEASPLVLVTEASGLDWTHAQPQMYALSGVEWFQRRSYRGPLAGGTLLLVGCIFAFVASGRWRRLSKPEERSLDEPSG